MDDPSRNPDPGIAWRPEADSTGSESAPAPTPGSRAPLAPGRVPLAELRSLDTLWFQVAGTVCNLACTHCFVSSSPTNHTHEAMTLAEIVPYLDEAAGLGVREFYFTGGEPFLNPEMEAILAKTLEYGPANVLTNGLLLDPSAAARLEPWPTARTTRSISASRSTATTPPPTTRSAARAPSSASSKASATSWPPASTR